MLALSLNKVCDICTGRKCSKIVKAVQNFTMRFSYLMVLEIVISMAINLAYPLEGQAASFPQVASVLLALGFIISLALFSYKLCNQADSTTQMIYTKGSIWESIWYERPIRQDLDVSAIVRADKDLYMFAMEQINIKRSGKRRILEEPEEEVQQIPFEPAETVSTARNMHTEFPQTARGLLDAPDTIRKSLQEFNQSQDSKTDTEKMVFEFINEASTERKEQ
jgi:hypothetical protein